MIIDYTVIESLLRWGSAFAPCDTGDGHMKPLLPLKRRRVRIEIGAETESISVPDYPHVWPSVPRVVCRVYLAEPRCLPEDKSAKFHIPPCECQPIAETRIG